MTASTVNVQTKPRRERRTMLFHVSETNLLPLDVKLPEPIAKANEAAHEAVAQFRAARQEAGRLEAEAKAAPNFDRIATEAAVAVGEPTPPATAAAKRGKADDARRTADAAEVVARQRIRALYDAVEDHLEEYRSTLRDTTGRGVAPLLQTVPTLVDQLIAVRRDVDLHEIAERWHNNPNSASLSSNSDPERTIGRAYHRALDKRRTMSPNAPVHNTLPELLAALTIALEAELGGES